jgi:enoyl-CoA hydratase/carnithine racemase
MSDDLVHYSTDDGVGLIELDDPPANTYTHEMMEQLDEAILEARFDEEAETIVLTGAGENFFSAGADISMLNEAEEEFKYNFCLHANETLLRLEHTPKLVVAALNGHTVGGGLEIALACDLRIAREDAGTVGLPEVNLGVLPGTGGTQRLTRELGKTQALEMMANGDTFDFETAEELGLVQEIIEGDAESFRTQALDFARGYTTPEKATKAVGHIKRAVTSGGQLPVEQGLTLERELQQQLFASDDADEGLAAYVEDRKAEFEGN